MRVVELRAIGGRAVVVGAPGPAGAPVRALPPGLPALLVSDLEDWARVVASPTPPASPAAVSRRGRQLAARVSAALDVAVDYCDPVSGHRVALRPVTRTPRPPPVPVLPRSGHAGRPAPGPPAPGLPAAGRARPALSGEPTPWATGLTLSALTAGLVLLANLALAGPMVAGLGWIGVVVDVAVAAGLLPALWLNRHVRTWRWAVWGTIAGMMAAVPFLAVQAAGA